MHGKATNKSLAHIAHQSASFAQVHSQSSMAVQARPPGQLKNVLIIDGAYLQIGISQMNQTATTNFVLDAPGNFLVLITFLEAIVGYEFDQIRFVTAEDTETKHKHLKLYEAIDKARG